MSDRGPGVRGLNTFLWETAVVATLVTAGVAMTVAPSVLNYGRAKLDHISGKAKLKKDLHCSRLHILGLRHDLAEAIERWERAEASLARATEAREWAERQAAILRERVFELEREVRRSIEQRAGLEEQLEAAVRRGNEVGDRLQLEQLKGYGNERLAERQGFLLGLRQSRATEGRLRRAYRLQGYLQDMRQAVESTQRDVALASALHRGRYGHERLGERQQFVSAQQQSWTARRLCKAYRMQKHLQLLQETVQSAGRTEALARAAEARMEVRPLTCGAARLYGTQKTQRLYAVLGVVVFLGAVGGYCGYLTYFALSTASSSGMKTAEGGNGSRAILSGVTDVPPERRAQGPTWHHHQAGGAGLEFAAHRGPGLQVRLWSGAAAGETEGPFQVPRVRGAAPVWVSRRGGRIGRQGESWAPPLQHHV